MEESASKILGPPSITFGDQVIVDPSNVASEPSIRIAEDGTIYSCAPNGLGHGTDVWRSKDGGKSFQFLGRDVQEPTKLVVRSVGGDLGGGDCDLAVDPDGTIYLVDLWLGSVSVSSSRDRGETWMGVPVSHAAAPVDRPWAAAGNSGELFILAAQATAYSDYADAPNPSGLWVIRSTDGGLTFPQQVKAVSNDQRIGFYGNIVFAGGSLYFPYFSPLDSEARALMVAASHDRGMTWSSHEVARQKVAQNGCFATLWFPSLAADETRGVYVAWALDNPLTGRVDLFFASSSDGGETWNDPQMLADRPGARVIPGIAVEEKGHVGIVWYETNTVTRIEDTTSPSDLPVTAFCDWVDAEEAEWHVHYAFSARGDKPNPEFLETIVSPIPVHKGPLARPFAEVLQVDFDPQGRAATVYVADVPGVGEGRPVFALQSR